MTDADRIPVIIGVGQVNDRPANPADGRDPIALMEAALQMADADAGGDWLGHIQSLAVVRQISFPDLGNVAPLLASRLDITPRYLEQTSLPGGDSPILLMNQAANRIGRKEISVAAIVGGEALRTARHRVTRPGLEGETNAMRAFGASRAQGLRHRYGLVAPIDIYPLYENATRHAWCQSLAEAQQETGDIWARLSAIAADNPHAWSRNRLSRDSILSPSADNRLLAFPYTKLMVANSSVNQGAGFLMTSLAEARARHIPEERIIYIGHGAAAHEPEDIFARASYAASPAMAVTLERVMSRNGLAAGDLDHVELYSCFPCIPKMARRIIGWPVERSASLVGGLTFGGGPIGNYMSHAVAAMVERLRRDSGIGLLYANGGLATHNHAIILACSSLPGTSFPHHFDVNDEADRRRDPAPRMQETYAGHGMIETFTVLYEPDGTPRQGVVIGRSPDNARFLARVSAGSSGIAMLTSADVEVVGRTGTGFLDDEGIVNWRFD